MYVWMILATFMVMLMAFNLSPRNDAHQQINMPLAEGAITKFLVQHDAAVKYVKHVLALRHNEPENPSNTGLAVNNHEITGCSSGSGNLCNLLPIGFQYEQNLYNSTYYCLNAAEYNYNTETVEDPTTGETTTVTTRVQTKLEGIESGNSCNETIKDGKTNSIYVITYGRVPERWKNVSSNKILGDYYNAMHKSVAVGSPCGIVRPKLSGNDDRNTMNSDFIVEGIDVKNNSIPPYFIQNDTGFKEKCLSGSGVNPNFPCIIYVTNI